MSIPIYYCRQCRKSGLNPLMHIRYRLNANNLILDIGNLAVAEKCIAFLTTELSNVKRNLEDQAKPLEFITPTDERLPVYPNMLRKCGADLGVKEVKKVSHKDVDFEI